MDYQNDEWQRKSATLSDKTARQEFGLTQDEIYDAIDVALPVPVHSEVRPFSRLLTRPAVTSVTCRPRTGSSALATAHCPGRERPVARQAEEH